MCLLNSFYGYNLDSIINNEVKMKSIHLYWRKWNHIEKLIEKRIKTLKSQGYNPMEIEDILSKELPSDFPNAFTSRVLTPFFNQMKEVGFDDIKIVQETDTYKILFISNNNIEAVLKFKIVNTEKMINKEASILTLTKDGNDIAIDNDSTPLDFIEYMD